VAMNSNRDSMEFSVMTYRSYEGAPTGGVSNETWGYAQSLMMYDIAAIQQMYGANFNTNSSNTTYTFSTTTGEMFVNGVGQGTPGGNRVFRTIWDGNGTDTYDFSNYTTNLAINLAPGGWSDLDVGGNFQRAQLGTNKYARGHVFNALQYNGDTRSLIENANGGSGNDIIEGNSANNVLHGNGGNDTISGGGGDDYMDGGAGWDTVDYSYWGGGGTYNLATGVASFPGFYDEEILNFEGIITGAGNDNVIGSATDNRIETGAGNDTVSGGAGNDSLNGYGGTIGEYDVLSGDYSFSQPGVQDTSDGADTFILGDAFGAYYLGLGYATITDFYWYEGDKFQVHGSVGDYSLGFQNWSGDSLNDTLIYYQSDLIAVVEDTTNVIASLDFIFV
ncbi:MAG: M10 family metallopeptidase C-terminal domain-containing protein, partial [Coleofasciculus sp. S288]|nr:M10 family metallopeptidase C-terminal domain-containing protein [Coleofasciculus sp. S288]